MKAKGAKLLEECDETLGEMEEEIEDLKKKSEVSLTASRKLETEIAQGDADLANLRGNVRIRKMVKDIADTRTELGKIDLDDAARSRRNFESKWKEGKEEEERLNNEVGLNVSHCCCCTDP